jgi:hypothetical protein
MRMDRLLEWKGEEDLRLSSEGNRSLDAIEDDFEIETEDVLVP